VTSDGYEISTVNLKGGMKGKEVFFPEDARWGAWGGKVYTQGSDGVFYEGDLKGTTALISASTKTKKESDFPPAGTF
jgi:hypothetical protein